MTIEVTGSIDEPKVLRARGFDGVVHGFTTRLGGVSRMPYASLNLGSSVGDADADVAKNHEIVATAAKFKVADLSTPAKQVHGGEVRTVTAVTMNPGDCDALTTGTPGVVVGIRVADCVPILLWDPQVNAVAAVHAGWRGVVARIPFRAVVAMVERHQASPARIRAAIGPAIGPCCYEVGPDVARQVTGVAEHTPRFQVIPTGGGIGVIDEVKMRVDLRAATVSLLLDAGVEKNHIELVGGCTSCEEKLFFSHRRDKGTTGRHLAFVGARGTRR